MPFDLHLKMSFDELKDKLGEPIISDASNDDGTPYCYSWIVDIDEKLETQIGITLFNQSNKKSKIPEIRLSIIENHPLIQFWHPTNGENFESFIKNLSYDTTIKHQFEPLNHVFVQGLFFLRWLIENDFIIKTDENIQYLQDVENGKKDIFEFLKELNMCYLGESDIIPEKQLIIESYIRDTMDNDESYYGDDIQALFLTPTEIKRNKQNPFDDNEDDWLDDTPLLNERVIYNDENYQKVKTMLDKKDF